MENSQKFLRLYVDELIMLARKLHREGKSWDEIIDYIYDSYRVPNAECVDIVIRLAKSGGN